MLEQDQSKIVAAMREHFSKATDGDASLLWEEVKGESAADAQKAIKEHRMEKGAQAYRPDIRRVRSLATSYRLTRQRANSKEQKIIDWLRLGSKASEYRGMDRVATLTLHFGDCWRILEGDKSIDDYGRQMSRAFILSHARHGFVEIGLSAEDAESCAREAVCLSPGESIKGGKMFRTVSEPAKSIDALANLAQNSLPNEAA